MKKFLFMGGIEFMGALTLLLVATVAWIIYQFVVGLNSKQPNKEEVLRKLGYGKSMALFALVTGFLGQMLGLSGAFQVIRDYPEITTAQIFDGIGVSMISSTYGAMIFLFSMILWFIATLIIEKKL